MKRYYLYLKTLTVVTSTLLLSAAVAQQCGTVGHKGTQANSARIENAFYINRGDPASCDGMITSVSFCFYRSAAIGHAYSTNFAIYRDQGNNVYEAVSTPREIRITHAQYQAVLGQGTFGCMSMNLAEPLMIQEGDVLGICVVEVFNENGLVIRRLELAGSPAGASGDLRTRNPVPNQCLTANTVPASVTTTGSSTSDVYLSANIVPLPITQSQTTTQLLTETTQSPGLTSHQTTIEDKPTVEMTTQIQDNNAQESSEDSASVIAAAVSVLLLVIALGAIITVVVLLMIFRVKRRKSIDNNKSISGANAKSSPTRQTVNIKFRANTAYSEVCFNEGSQNIAVKKNSAYSEDGDAIITPNESYGFSLNNEQKQQSETGEPREHDYVHIYMNRIF